ncbi:MAG TPA: DUF11 domain-containing protein [Planctomycetaceae bacterium]|nr:DUF11 domain-containing protein [Planctomycetaceae bacterium]
MTQRRSSLRRRWRAGAALLRRAARRQIGQQRRALRAATRNVAWQLAAVTGIAGIVLLLLMQLSAMIASQAAGETQTMRPAENALRASVTSPDDGTGASPVFDDGPLVPIPERELPGLVPFDTTSEFPQSEPEPAPDVDLELVVARLEDRDERFAIASPSPDPHTAVLPPAASSGEEPWGRFDRLRDDGAALSDARRSAVLRVTDAPPLEPLEPETAPDGIARFDVSIEKHVPETGVAFQPLDYEIVVRNTGVDEVPQITIDELLPSSQRIERTVPAARVAGQSLSWQLRDISPGEVRRLHVRTTPTAAGDDDAAAVVEATAAVAATTRVAAPRVRLDVLAPDHNTSGRLTTLTFRVTNEGDVEAADLVLQTDLPELLTHPLGRELDYLIGTLPPGESREMTLTALAETTGTALHASAVLSRGESLATSEHSLAVEADALTLRREGLKQPPVGEAVEFTNHVVNDGDRTLHGLEVVETVPEGFEVVSVADGGRFDRATGTIHWELGELAAGRRVTLGATLRAGRAGELRSVVTASSADHPEETIQATVTAGHRPPAGANGHRSPVRTPSPGFSPICPSCPACPVPAVGRAGWRL